MACGSRKQNRGRLTGRSGSAYTGEYSAAPSLLVASRSKRPFENARREVGHAVGRMRCTLAESGAVVPGDDGPSWGGGGGAGQVVEVCGFGLAEAQGASDGAARKWPVPCPLPTKSAAKLAVGDWIERVDNRRRRLLRPGCDQRPVDFEDRLNQPAQAA